MRFFRLFLLCCLGLFVTPSCKHRDQIPVVPVVESIDIADLQELEAPKLSLFVGLVPDQAVYALVTFFAERGLLGSFWRDPTALRIRTAWTEEPEDNQRLRRIHYAMRIETVTYRTDCTIVEVRWAIQSRTYTDYNWTNDKVSDLYEPLLLPGLSALFASKPCPPL